MTEDQRQLEILRQRRERIVRRFWFEDRRQMVCESAAAIRAVAMLSVRIRMLTDRLPARAAA